MALLLSTRSLSAVTLNDGDASLPSALDLRASQPATLTIWLMAETVYNDDNTCVQIEKI